MSATKYKVGDKVLIRENLIGEAYYDGLYFANKMEEYCGKVVELVGKDDDSYIVKKTNENNAYWSFNDEMIAGKVEFTKADLKTGMICTDRAGREWLVLKDCACKDKIENIMVYNGGWNHLTDYNDDLKACNGYKEYDIAKIETTYAGNIGDIFGEERDFCRKLIWKRNDKLEQAKQLLV